MGEGICCQSVHHVLKDVEIGAMHGCCIVGERVARRQAPVTQFEFLVRLLKWCLVSVMALFISL